MPQRSFPLFPYALAILAAAMLVPAGFAAIEEEWKPARSFLYGAIATGFASATLGVALAGPPRLRQGQGELVNLMAIWLVLPLFAAIPLQLITPRIGFHGAWFEMVAAFTTTGGTVYLSPENVPRSVHLWRGLGGWLGGLVTLTAAFAILAPRQLGGFEVLTQQGGSQMTEMGAVGRRVEIGAAAAPMEDRVRRALRAILPVYAGLTIVLGLTFAALGKPDLASAIHAMSILSTSGITSLPDGFATDPDFRIEIVAAVFMVLAATRLIYARATQIGTRAKPLEDPELRLMGFLVTISAMALFLRHWFGALTVDDAAETDIWDAVAALWGNLFTAISFITTTGLESGYWERARDWSGLSNPGLLFLGLAAIGGGAATTAGGIKLIRAFALLRHGRRELDRLAQPNAVLGVGSGIRGLLRQGAFICWAFIMLYSCAVFVLMLSLALTGMRFEPSLIAALSALTNTGPAYTLVLGEAAGGFALFDQTQRTILALGMILGRIETLVVIALFSPDVWRRMRTRKKTTGNARFHTSKSGW